MRKNIEILQNLKGQLIVSCQALEDEPLYSVDGGVMPLMAKAAMEAGARGIRANGVRDIKEIKEVVSLPIIGIIKKKYKGFDHFITATMDEVDKLVEAEVEIIALDCTMRKRGDGLTISDFIKKIINKYPNQLFMADISTVEEGINAVQAGIQIVGTTLSGYTDYSLQGSEPDFDLVRELVEKLNVPVFAEGKIYEPDQAAKMLDIGAHTVIVGSAITRPKVITKRYVDAIKRRA